MTLPKKRVLAIEEHAVRARLLSQAEKEGRGIDQVRDQVQKDASYMAKVEKLLSGMYDIDSISLADMQAAFPGIADKFWSLFSIARGEGPQIEYPTEQSVFELKPLIRLPTGSAFCLSINALFNAVLSVCELNLSTGRSRDRFFRLRDETLENEAVTHFRSILGSETRTEPKSPG